MKQITDRKELIGKTILNTGYSDNIYMLYLSDECFAIFRGCGYECQDVELMEEEFSLKPTNRNCYELYELGLISKEDMDNIYRDFELKRQEEIEKKEKQEYERLKSKFKN